MNEIFLNIHPAHQPILLFVTRQLNATIYLTICFKGDVYIHIATQMSN